MPRQLLLLIGLVCVSFGTQAFELTPQKLSDNVYALIGPTGGRNRENEGLNANYGFIVTRSGVILIDSGASVRGAQVLRRAVRRVTSKPVRWVINTGSQDHRWLGNDAFHAQGAQVLALKRTVETQKEFAAQHLSRLKTVLGEHLAGTVPRFADRVIEGDHARLDLDGEIVELHWFGDAHFPGDTVVWLPREKILFSGDLIYVERMLGVLPWSPVISWRAALDTALTQLQPRTIVPGHGPVCDAQRARADTGAYLGWLIEHIKPAAENWEGLEATVQTWGNDPRWRHLKNYTALHRGNVNRAYVQFENNMQGELPAP